MAEDLANIRPMFVKKVSEPMIKELLDDVLRDGVLSNLEAEAVAGKKDSRADMARKLIDSVRRKGENASMKLIAHIKKRDPELFAELDLSLLC